MSTTRTCPRCGHEGCYTSTAIADARFPRHSCAKQRRRREASLARARRDAGERRRDCLHAGQPHRHGTRAAYVRDRCRCRPCTEANTTASRRADRTRTYGRWQPYVDAAPVRKHLAALHAAGLSYKQLARLADTSVSNIRAIAGTLGDGRPTTRRVRPSTAQRILAITAVASQVPPFTRIDATGTTRRLQALVRNGWPIATLADELSRDPSSLRHTMRSDRVLAATAEQVAELYARLWDQPAPQTTRRERIASVRARTQAEGRGWLPPLSWDDIDHDPEPRLPAPSSGAEIDEIAVERAVAGDGIRLTHLTPAEQAEAIRRLTENGKSIRDIADVLCTTTRTVSRRRRRIRAA